MSRREGLEAGDSNCSVMSLVRRSEQGPIPRRLIVSGAPCLVGPSDVNDVDDQYLPLGLGAYSRSLFVLYENGDFLPLLDSLGSWSR